MKYILFLMLIMLLLSDGKKEVKIMEIIILAGLVAYVVGIMIGVFIGADI